jgi:hypothetical protein
MASTSKTSVSASLPIPNTTNGIVHPSLGKALLLEERAKRFQTGRVYAGKKTAERWRDEEGQHAQKEP